MRAEPDQKRGNEMEIETVARNGVEVAVVTGAEVLLADVSSALDLMMSVKYQTGCSRVAVNKGAVGEDFFILSTRLAGEVLQKFINYGVKLAIFGDFSGYTSKPLHDFIYESNRGRDVFFASDREDAVERLANAR